MYFEEPDRSVIGFRFQVMCCICKRIKNEDGVWLSLHITNEDTMSYSHGICPDCMLVKYPDCRERSVPLSSVVLEKLHVPV